jgi:hypothetical protein
MVIQFWSNARGLMAKSLKKKIKDVFQNQDANSIKLGALGNGN